MDHLWSPWRYQYLRQDAPPGCVFCHKAQSSQDAEDLIVHRAQHCYVLLNLYPYATGHVLIAPYGHTATLSDTAPEVLREMMDMAQLTEKHLRTIYQPQGFNMGMNIGACAGAGIAGHIHMHVLPRWPGDVNFMTAVAETRVMLEELGVTYRKLREQFSQA